MQLARVHGSKRWGRWCLPLLVTILVVQCSSYPERVPLTLEQAIKAEVQLPLYVLKPERDARLEVENVVYYYFDFTSEIILDAYFTVQKTPGGDTRVAKLSVFNATGSLVISEETKPGEFSLDWAAQRRGYICKALPHSSRNDLISGDGYQSCLYWLGKERYQYKLYTVWPEDEAIQFVSLLTIATSP
jgi:hypothetical protein